MQKNKISENNQKIKEETNTMAVDFWNEDEILNEEEYCPDLSWWYEVDVEKEMEEMRRLEFKENEWMIKKHIVTNVAYTIKDIIVLRVALEVMGELDSVSESIFRTMEEELKKIFDKFAEDEKLFGVYGKVNDSDVLAKQAARSSICFREAVEKLGLLSSGRKAVLDGLDEEMEVLFQGFSGLGFLKNRIKERIEFMNVGNHDFEK